MQCLSLAVRHALVEFLYLSLIVAFGFGALILLAHSAETLRNRGLAESLSRIPDFDVHRWTCSWGRGLGVDRQGSSLCLITTRAGRRSMLVVPSSALQRADVLLQGRPVLQARRVGQAAPATATRWSSADPPIALLLTLGGAVRRHVTFFPDMRSAVQWRAVTKSLMKERFTVRVRSTGDGMPQQGADDGPAPAKEGARTEPETCLNIQRALHPLILERLDQRRSFVLGERRLRDLSGVQTTLIHFHDCMNVLKRERRFDGISMTYSRKDETWKFSRRK